MARIPRRQMIDEHVPGLYHVYSRTVRRTFLFGQDAVTGRDYAYRLEMLLEAVRTLSRIFAIDVMGFGFMQNHFHEILRNRPDLVRRMSNYQVALRTCLLEELGLNLTLSPKTRTPRERAHWRRKVEALMRDPQRIAKARADLSSISRYEQRLKGTIARLANLEDQVTGHFWAGRFESNPIEDSAQLLTAMVYVDLNPIHAGVAETPETSRYTSAYERIHGLKARLNWSEAAASPSGLLTNEQLRVIEPLADQREIRQLLDDWLSPIDERREGRAQSTLDWLEPMIDPNYELWVPEKPSVEQVVQDSQPDNPSTDTIMPVDDLPDVTRLPARASNRGCLAMTVCEYLQVVDWTGRQVRADKKGQIPADLPPILERLGFADPAAWLTQLAAYGQKLKRAFSAPVNQLAEAARCVVATCQGLQAMPEALM